MYLRRKKKKSISPDWPNALKKYERFFSCIRMSQKTWLNQNTIPKPIENHFVKHCELNKPNIIWVRLTCALRTHINFSIFINIVSGIEKAVITFSILEIFFFQKWKLMCTLRAHISKILYIYISVGSQIVAHT